MSMLAFQGANTLHCMKLLEWVESRLPTFCLRVYNLFSFKFFCLISFLFRRRVEMILAMKGDVNAQNDDGDTPLHLACRMGDIPTVRMLLARHDVDTSILNFEGETAAAITSSRVES